MSPTQAVALGPPRDRKLSKDGRTITFSWVVGEIDPEFDGGRPRRVITELDITHTKAGVNYFAGTRHIAHYYACVRRSTEEDVTNHDGQGTFVMRSMKIAPGQCLTYMHLEGPRFNRNTLGKFADTALTRLRGMADEGDERILRFFEVWA